MIENQTSNLFKHETLLKLRYSDDALRQKGPYILQTGSATEIGRIDYVVVQSKYYETLVPNSLEIHSFKMMDPLSPI